jgi:hypothetical protein
MQKKRGGTIRRNLERGHKKKNPKRRPLKETLRRGY